MSCFVGTEKKHIFIKRNCSYVFQSKLGLFHPPSNWILMTGVWRDLGVWEDDAHWRD